MGLFVHAVTVGLGLVFGCVGHEFAHYAVWKLGGRDPCFSAREWCVRPRRGPPRVIPLDRVAAAAPYALAVLLAFLAITSVSTWTTTRVLLLEGVVIGMLIPSLDDALAILGHGQWDELNA